MSGARGGAPPRRRGHPRGSGAPRRPRGAGGKVGRGLARRRIRVTVTVAALAFGTITARAAWVGVVKHGELSAEARNQTNWGVTLPAPRGSILAADSSQLAVDKPVTMVSATPYLITDPAKVAAEVAPILGMQAADVQAKISQRVDYVPLDASLSPAAAQRLRALGINGIDLTDAQQRIYPQAPLASQVVGFLGADRKGIDGLELSQNAALTGVDGKIDELRDPVGQTIRILDNREPVAGRSVATTLDPQIQAAVQQTLAESVRKTRAKAAMAVVMRPSDGAILAVASAPGFDPRDRRHLEQANVRLRPITDVFEPGSVFKIVTMAGAIDQGLVSPTTRIWVPPTMSVYDRTLGEAEPQIRAQYMTVAHIIAISSNVGTVKVAELGGAKTGGPRRFVRWAHRLGFGLPTGIDLPGEDPGYVKPVSKWDGVSILNLPIGQGLTVNLLQLARAYASVANGGMLVTPHVVRAVGGVPVRLPPPRRVMKPSTARALNGIFQGVVADSFGTGTAARVPGYSVAGKTGTANIWDPTLLDSKTGLRGMYSTSKHYASFVGFLPASRPKVVIAVALDQPVRQFYGGEVAAPDFSTIAQAALNQLDIRPDRPLPGSQVASGGG